MGEGCHLLKASQVQGAPSVHLAEVQPLSTQLKHSEVGTAKTPVRQPWACTLFPLGRKSPSCGFLFCPCLSPGWPELTLLEEAA